MKKKVIIWIAAILIVLNASAQNTDTYYINAPRFTHPLLEKWIQEYKKVKPEVNLAIAKSDLKLFTMLTLLTVTT